MGIYDKGVKEFGFSETMIDMIWRLVSSNWYLVLVNGQSYDFFQSSSGVKQGDPLSPVLFIIAAEVMSRSLNNLFQDENFVGFGLPKWRLQINHLSYANDTIIFGSGDTYSIGSIMSVLCHYEQMFGQMINKDKSFFYIHENTPLGWG